MRQIEYRMNRAISNCIDWKEKNTRVEYNAENDTNSIYLHDNLIAIVGDNYIQLFDGTFQSHTTKSRLNSILLLNGGGYVFQRNFKWYVNIDDQTVEFENGMILK